MFNKSNKNIIIVISILFFGISCLILLMIDNKNALNELGNNVISISEKSGFYNNSLSISIKVNKNELFPEGTKVYYTLNGNNPTIESQEYVNPISLEIENSTKVYPLKIVAYFDGKYSKIIEKTFVLDKDIKHRFDLDVISITSDEKNLYDYYTGILVPGVTYDTNKENGATGFIHGNYNMRTDEWLRDAYITMFDYKGNKLLDQEIGIMVSGGTSATMHPRSLKLVADNYNNTKINLNLYQDYNYNDNSMPFAYNSLKLRAGGQDRANSNIRSAITSVLCKESHFDGCSTTRRAIVYLNGSFYGIYDIQQTYAKSFLKNKFGLDDSSKIVSFKNWIGGMHIEADLSDLAQKDLNTEENRQKLEEYVDIDNYFLYYAIESILNNTDWPSNSRMWRYTGEFNENNKYSDGKYRFLIYDTDLIYYSYDSIAFEGADGDTFISVMDRINRGFDSAFGYLMNYDFYRDRFVNLVLDLFNTSFKKENVLKIVDEEYNKIKKENLIQFGEKTEIVTNINIELMKEKIINREKEMENNFKHYFNFSDKYLLSIQNTSGIQIKWNNMSLLENETYSNKYYIGSTIKFDIVEYPGYTFEYWLVNGQKIYDKTLTIKSQKKNSEIVIQPVARKNDTNLIINEIFAKGNSDWLRLTNIGNDSIWLNEYYLTDSDNNLTKYNLPNAILKPGDSVYIYGKNNYHKIGSYICNFNLSNGEIVYLTYKNNIIDKIYVPKINEYETYGHKDNSNEFVYFYNYSGERNE